MTIDELIIPLFHNAPSLECAGYQKLEGGGYLLLKMCLLSLGTIPEQAPCRGNHKNCEFKRPIQLRLFRKGLRER